MYPRGGWRFCIKIKTNLRKCYIFTSPEAKRKVALERSTTNIHGILLLCVYSLIRVRKAEERQRKEAELRRLKNIKREEIRKRLQTIREMSGGALVDEELGGADGGAGRGKGVGADAQAILDGDFDPLR